MNKLRQSYVFAGLAVFFWSTVPTAFKLSLAELDVLTMLTIASGTSAVVLLIIVLATGKIELIFNSTTKDLLASALLGLINPFIYYIIVLRAYTLLPAQIAQPLNMIWPIVLVFLSVPILKQKIEKKSYIALLLSFAGVCLISGKGRMPGSGTTDLTGVLLATGSSVFWAIYFILNLRDKRDEAVKLFLNFLFGFVYLVGAMTLTGRWGHNISPKGTAGAIYIGLFEMGITFFFWLRALSLAPSTARISNLVYISPFISLLFVHLILKEPVYYTTLSGLILITAGILIQNRKSPG
jgi:drug/metabolite transporter (DMT)-like permease